MQLHRLLSSFTKLDHVENVADLTQRANLLRGQILENWVLQNRDRKDPRTMMLVWDTGSSYVLTPFRSDFIDYVEFNITVKYVTKVNRNIGIRTNLHNFIERNVQDILLPCISYHLTQIDVQLFSPHTYHQIHGGHSIVHSNQVTTHLPFHSILIPVDLEGTNLSVFHNSFVTEHQNRAIGPQMRSSLAYSRLSKLYIFGDLNTIRYLQDMDISNNQMKIEHEFEHHYSHLANQNLSGPQKGSLFWK